MVAYRSDPGFRRFSPDAADVAAESGELLERFIGWQRERPRVREQLAIVLAGSGEVVGNVGLRRGSPTDRVAETGFELAPAHWGQGYATEAARTLLHHGFAELGLHRVHAHCVAENVASARVLERLGMRKEGVLREHEFFRERWWDVFLYGILEREWRSRSLTPDA